MPMAINDIDTPPAEMVWEGMFNKMENKKKFYLQAEYVIPEDFSMRTDDRVQQQVYLLAQAHHKMRRSIEIAAMQETQRLFLAQIYGALHNNFEVDNVGSERFRREHGHEHHDWRMHYE